MNDKNPNYCKASVWHERFHSQCSRKPWKDGYCKQHHPDTQAKRDAKRSAKWKIESRMMDMRHERYRLEGQCLELVKELAKKKTNKKAMRIVKQMNKLKLDHEAALVELEKLK